MKSAVVKIGVVVTGALLLMGIGSSPPLKDGRFDVTSVTITGPGSIGNGSSANYTVTTNIRRTGAKNSDTLTGTGSPPQIRPAIYSGGTQVAFQAINFASEQNTATTTLSLNCSNNEVKGSVAGTGHGQRNVRQWYCFWLCTVNDPAKVKGHLNETESAEISVLCN